MKWDSMNPQKQKQFQNLYHESEICDNGFIYQHKNDIKTWPFIPIYTEFIVHSQL